MRILKRYPVLIGVVGTIAVGSLLAAGDEATPPPAAPIASEEILPADSQTDPTPAPEESPELELELELEPTPTPTLPPTPTPEPTFEYVEAVPWVPGAPIDDLPPAPVIHEDDPRWDCRVMGNQVCGIQIHGTWYVVSFDAGTPTGVSLRGF